MKTESELIAFKARVDKISRSLDRQKKILLKLRDDSMLSESKMLRIFIKRAVVDTSTAIEQLELASNLLRLDINHLIENQK